MRASCLNESTATIDFEFILGTVHHNLLIRDKNRFFSQFQIFICYRPLWISICLRYTDSWRWVRTLYAFIVILPTWCWFRFIINKESAPNILVVFAYKHNRNLAVLLYERSEAQKKRVRCLTHRASFDTGTTQNWTKSGRKVENTSTQLWTVRLFSSVVFVCVRTAQNS